MEERQFCSGSLGYVCCGEGHNCSCHFTNPSPRYPATSQPQCRMGELEESFHLTGKEWMGALWGGEAEEAKLQSSTVRYPAVGSDPLS